MDLSRHLSNLIAPLELGATIVDSVRLVDVSSDYGLRLTCVVPGGHELYVEIEPASDQRKYAARTRRLQLSYRGAVKSAPIDPALGLAVCRRVAELVERNELRVLAELESEREQEGVGAKLREVRVSRLLEAAGTPGERWLSLNPYVGCLIGCRFCYAQSRIGISRELGGLPPVAWGSYVDVRVNAAEVLAGELERLPPLPIKFCPIVSDPYHAVEKRYRITRACLETLRASQTTRPVFVLSRSATIAEDAELIGSLPGAYAGASIPTLDDEVRRHFEPRGSPIAERLAALARLREAGARTFAIVQPILPGSVEALAEALARHVSSVRIDVLHGVEGAEEDFADPRYSAARDPAWQRERADVLAEALRGRGVDVWPGELPSELRSSG